MKVCDALVPPFRIGFPQACAEFIFYSLTLSFIATDHFIPRLDGFGDGGGFVLARRGNRGTDLPADRTGHSVDDFVTPICGTAGAANYIGFGATGAMSFSHDSEWVLCG